MAKLVSVEARPGQHLWVEYDDGVEGEIDLSDLVGKGVFSALSDPSFFARVAIGSGGEITWSEDLDICPDAVYLELTGKKPEELFPHISAKGSRA